MSDLLAMNPRDYLDYRINQMRDERSGWLPHWRMLNENFSPRKGRFLTSDVNKAKDKKNTNNIINNTPVFARRTLRSGLMTGMTNPARPWFRYNPPDPDMNDYGPVRAWLDLVQAQAYKIYSKSGLYRVLPNIYDACGVIGTGALVMEEDFDTVARFTPFATGEYMLDINDRYEVDTFGLEQSLTVKQMVQKFKDVKNDGCSGRVKDLYNRKQFSTRIDVRWLIEPNDDDMFGVPEKFKFRSLWWEVGEKGEGKLLRREGYYEFPIMAPRWDTEPGDTYGISPGMDGMGDSKALQIQEREKGKAVAKMVSPPTIAPTSLQGRNISLLPGGNTFSDDPNASFRPVYQVDPRVNELSMDIQRTEDRINRAFYVDLFLMIQSDNRNQRATAAEIAERHEEKLLQLGPVLQNLNDELLSPVGTRCFNMMMRASEPAWRGVSNFMMIPPPPDELKGVELEVEYVSTLAQAQKMVDSGTTERWVGFVGQVAHMIPSVLDKVDGDGVVDIMAKDLGVPAKAVVADDIVQARRAQAAQQQQMQQQLEMTAQAAESAKVLSETQTTGDSVLSSVLGMGQQQAAQQ